MLLLSRGDVAALLTLDACIEVVAHAFAAHAEGRSLGPALMHIDAVDGEFHIKAGGLTVGSRPYFALKANGGFFGNAPRHGLPNIVGVIYLADAANGLPVAIMDSSVITLMRTGAATALAARYLSRPDTRVATVCGAGRQGRIQLCALCHERPVTRAYVWSRNDATAARFAEEMGAELQMTIQPVSNASALREAIARSDAVITCTPSQQPLVEASWIRTGTFVAAVGADSPGKQELDPRLLGRATVVTDLTEQCAAVGELRHAIEAGIVSERDVHAELGEIVAGRKPGRRHTDEIIVFDSTGTALQDVAAAVLVYERACAAHAGMRFTFLE